MMRLLFSFLCISLFSLNIHSQNADKANPIDEEFSELMETSNDFKGYKVVDYDKLTALQDKTSIFINGLQQEIEGFAESIDGQKEEIAGLKADLAEIKLQLEAVTAEKDAITFLGMPFDKTSYKLIMWGLVGILILSLGLLVIRYKKSHIDTREAKKNLVETEKEFEAFRTKSLEKEQKLGRLLQDERNKLMKVAK